MKSGLGKRRPVPEGQEVFRLPQDVRRDGERDRRRHVSTPDHSHAPAAVDGLRLGKHVFCQKPLTYSVAEARLLRQLAAEKKLCTQMGNQGTADERPPRRRSTSSARATSVRSRRSTSGPTARSGRRARDAQPMSSRSRRIFTGKNSSAPHRGVRTTGLHAVQVARLARLRHRRLVIWRVTR